MLQVNRLNIGVQCGAQNIFSMTRVKINVSNDIMSKTNL